jgi:two-component system, sensor histidine kinase and response regulator
MPQAPESQSLILVVDDNEPNRALARATLEGEGHRVLLAADGTEALRLAQAEPPDCVLLDVRMPGMTGFEVCIKLRELPSGSDVPVVFLTALRDVDTFDEALRVGGDDFLTKPVRPTELVLRVQAALRLRRLNASNREYYELARRQRDDLMRLQLQKERLMAFVVHDLKNPVSSIDLCAQVLLRDKALPAHLRESALNIRDEGRALLRLIMNLLDISKSEEGKLVPKLARVELAGLMGGVVELMGARARARNVELELSVGDERVNADPDLLRRVLENLLDNALKHSREGTLVRLTARAADGEVELRVADQGSGVPPELRESIFERFVQVESTDRAVTRAGRGLGLAFCRLAVEAQDGRIFYEDAAPGAIFCVRLRGA